MGSVHYQTKANGLFASFDNNLEQRLVTPQALLSCTMLALAPLAPLAHSAPSAEAAPSPHGWGYGHHGYHGGHGPLCTHELEDKTQEVVFTRINLFIPTLCSNP